jgi:NlpC/P60 family protein
MRPALAILVGLGGLALGCGGAAPRSEPPRSFVPSWPEPGTDPASATVIGFAEAQVGKRYCWGGTGPHCFDCSGLVQAAWRSGGVRLPRTAEAQGRVLVDVPLHEIRPGDILWWRHHVGIYVGRGEMIDAYHGRAGVVRRRAVIPDRVLRVVPAASMPRVR